MKELNQTVRKVLIVDNRPEELTPLVGLLEEQGCRVEIRRSGEEGLAKAREWQPDLVLLDVDLGRADKHGGDFFSEIKKCLPTQNVVYLTILLEKSKYYEQPLMRIGESVCESSGQARDPLLSKHIGYKEIVRELFRTGRL